MKSKDLISWLKRRIIKSEILEVKFKKPNKILDSQLNKLRDWVLSSTISEINMDSPLKKLTLISREFKN